MYKGSMVSFRPVEESDAKFILALRLDPQLNQHISKTENDLEKQRSWINSCRQKKDEWYFIIQNNHQTPVGTVRIYDIQGTSFCWGSWIIQPEARLYATFESAILVYEHAFFTLNFSAAHFDVRKNNQTVIDFHLKLGATVIREDEQDLYFTFSKDDYLSKREDHMALITKISKRYNR